MPRRWISTWVTLLALPATLGHGAPAAAPSIAVLPAEGAAYAEAWAVNETGLVVGVRGDWPAAWRRDGDGRYQLDALEGPIEPPPGRPPEVARFGFAVDVNEAGLIVAVVAVDVEDQQLPRAAWWDAPRRVWRDLGLPSGMEGILIRGLNDEGVAVGTAWSPVGASVAVAWQDGAYRPLPPLVPGGDCGAFAINNAGEITGWCVDGERQRPVVWSDGAVTPLAAHGAIAFGRAIAEDGTVVGFVSSAARSTAGQAGQATVWRAPSRVEDQRQAGSATSVNASGDVVGFIGENGAGSVAALWRAGGQPPLTFPPLAGGRMAWFRDISDGGTMVGFADDAAKTVHAIIVVP